MPITRTILIKSSTASFHRLESSILSAKSEKNYRKGQRKRKRPLDYKPAAPPVQAAYFHQIFRSGFQRKPLLLSKSFLAEVWPVAMTQGRPSGALINW